MLPVAVFRFSPTEGPGHFADWMDARGVPWRLIALDEGEAVPADPRAFAGIGMMGGPMSVNDDLAWKAPMHALLRAAVAQDVPVLGHCLGGQLFAQALGARVARAEVAEIGWIDVEVDPVPAAREWFGARRGFPAFQWHYDAFALPQGATRVLTNAFNLNQAFVVGERHIGFQCHVEMTRGLVETWLGTASVDELPPASTGSKQSDADIRRDLDARVATLNDVASGIYARWSLGLRG
jgi:GMP synthase-like glutamine amidotransferase